MTDTHIAGMMLVREEGWCIKHTLAVALQWCDTLTVGVHQSSPQFVELVESLLKPHGDRVRCAVYNDDPYWSEMTLRQDLLKRAREYTPTHLAIVDGDEALTLGAVGHIRGWAAEHCRTPGTTMSLPMVSPYGDLWTRRVDGHYAPEGGVTVVFRDHPSLCYANADDGYCYHARQPRGSSRCSISAHKFARFGGMVHLQFASTRRLRAKSVWYKLVETLKFPGRMSAHELNTKYDWTLNCHNAEFYRMDHTFLHAFPTVDDIDIEQPSWQEHEARRMLAEHPPHTFKNVNLHGLTPQE